MKAIRTSPFARVAFAALAVAAAISSSCSKHVAELEAGPRTPAYKEPPAPPFNPHFERVVGEEDTRTPAQIEAAACTEAITGKWRCKKPKPPVAVAFASGGPGSPIIPSAWTIHHWFVDPQNTSGTASDSNSCTSSGAACLTWQEIAVHRLLCANERGCVRLRQTTDADFLSSHTNNSDPVYAVFALENSASFTVFAALPAPSITSTFTNVINWNGCGSNTRVSDAGNTIGVHGAFLQDLTAGGGSAINMWCNELSSGHNCNMTIPMTAVTAPPTALQTPGLWTSSAGGAGVLSIGDTYKFYPNPVAVDLVQMNPVMAEYTGATPTNGEFFYNIQILDPSGTPGTNPFFWGGDVVGYESRIDRTINLQGVSTKEDGCVNCWANGGLTGGRLSTGHFWHMLGGEITNTAYINATGNGIAFDGYLEMEYPATFNQGLSVGLVQGSFGTWTMSGYSTLSAISPGYSGVANGEQWCFGSGTINVQGNGALRYDNAHGGCAGVFPTPGTFQMSGSTTAESHSGTSPVVVTAGITVNCTNLDAAASTTAFGSAAYWKDEFLGAL